MKRLVMNLLPYGLVMKMASRKKEKQKEFLAKERAKDLLQNNAQSGQVNLKNDIRVNMGCGTNPEKGWVNIDGSASADINVFMLEDTVLPFEKDSVTAVFSEHFLEHVPLNVGKQYFRESFRILKSGGIFRVSCPDLDAIMGMNKNDEWKKLAHIYETIGDFSPGEIFCGAQVINWAFYGHLHCNLYNLEQITHELEAAGFTGVKRKPFGESSIPGAAIEKRKGEAFYSLIVEATKP